MMMKRFAGVVTAIWDSPFATARPAIEPAVSGARSRIGILNSGNHSSHLAFRRFRHMIGSGRRPRHTFLTLRSFYDFGDRVRALLISLIEIKLGIKLIRLQFESKALPLTVTKLRPPKAPAKSSESFDNTPAPTVLAITVLFFSRSHGRGD